MKKMKKMYKTLWVAAFLVIIGMFTTIVSAELVYQCTEVEKFELRSCLGKTITDDSWMGFCEYFDNNYDLVINLADLPYYANYCHSEEVVDEVSKVSESSGKSYSYVREKDGSLTFMSVGRAIQYPNNNMILTWNKEMLGVACWTYYDGNYCGTFYNNYGYNFVNVRVIG